MTPQEYAIKIIVYRVWSHSLYKEIVERLKGMARGEHEEYKQKHFPHQDKQWFATVLWELGEH
jgi:hypothetical protein